MFITTAPKISYCRCSEAVIELDGDELNAWQFAYRELQKAIPCKGL
jgi:hypothetical protein